MHIGFWRGSKDFHYTPCHVNSILLWVVLRYDDRAVYIVPNSSVSFRTHLRQVAYF